jgi:hypothetical protein
VGTDPSIWEPGPTIQNTFPLTKGPTNQNTFPLTKGPTNQNIFPLTKGPTNQNTFPLTKGPTNQNTFPLTKGLYYRHKYSVSSAVRVADLRRSLKGRSRMWRSWAGVVTRGSAVGRPVGRAAKFSTTTLEAACGREIPINSLATALVDIPAVSMPIARSLKIGDICGIVLWQNGTF